jgi:hypothetical protein
MNILRATYLLVVQLHLTRTTLYMHLLLIPFFQVSCHTWLCMPSPPHSGQPTHKEVEARLWRQPITAAVTALPASATAAASGHLLLPAPAS